MDNNKSEFIENLRIVYSYSSCRPTQPVATYGIYYKQYNSLIYYFIYLSESDLTTGGSSGVFNVVGVELFCC